MNLPYLWGSMIEMISHSFGYDNRKMRREYRMEDLKKGDCDVCSSCFSGLKWRLYRFYDTAS